MLRYKQAQQAVSKAIELWLQSSSLPPVAYLGCHLIAFEFGNLTFLNSDLSKRKINMTDQEIEEIFFPVSFEKAKKAKDAGNLFAYYTTADVAYQVIKNKRIWMRSTSTMNDYMEIQYGQNLLVPAIDGKVGDVLKQAIEACQPGLFEEVWRKLKAWLPGFAADTFITCVSEHDIHKENEIGRLSMWRAYGGKAGVAIVIDGNIFSIESEHLGASASPVAYLDREQFSDTILSIAANVLKNQQALKLIPRENLSTILFNMFRFAVLCTKHPGFAEEREWRVISSPSMYKSKVLEPEIAIIRGVPQPILKIPLEDFPQFEIGGLSIPKLVSRLIIGPCEFPTVTYRALFDALKESSIENPSEIICKSNIPLRQN